LSRDLPLRAFAADKAVATIGHDRVEEGVGRLAEAYRGVAAAAA
jgi:hypothetical protein